MRKGEAEIDLIDEASLTLAVARFEISRLSIGCVSRRLDFYIL